MQSMQCKNHASPRYEACPCWHATLNHGSPSRIAGDILKEQFARSRADNGIKIPTGWVTLSGLRTRLRSHHAFLSLGLPASFSALPPCLTRWTTVSQRSLDEDCCPSHPTHRPPSALMRWCSFCTPTGFGHPDGVDRGHVKVALTASHWLLRNWRVCD